MQPSVSCTPAAPSDVVLCAYLRDVGSSGPTAAVGAYASLQWVQTYMGFENMPLSSPIVQGFKHAKGHTPQQREHLPLMAFQVLQRIATSAHGT
eukprot:6531461-Karenia_brevis.AAC.1